MNMGSRLVIDQAIRDLCLRVSEDHGITQRDLASGGRRGSWARQRVFWMMRRERPDICTAGSIARCMGLDRSSVAYGIRRIDERVRAGRKLIRDMSLTCNETALIRTIFSLSK